MDLSIYNNLEELCSLNGYQGPVTDEILQSLLALKKVYFRGFYLMFDLKFVRDAVNYRREGLKYYLNGFDIDSDIVFDVDEGEFSFGSNEANTKFLVKNFNKSTDFIFNTYRLDLNYNILANNREFLEDNFFSDKIPEIKPLEVKNGLESETELLICLKKILISELIIKTKLSQSFYNQLPDYDYQIKMLSIKNGAILNFDFISKMFNLSDLRVATKICLNLVIKCFKNLENMTTVGFEKYNEIFLFCYKGILVMLMDKSIRKLKIFISKEHFFFVFK